jgi:uncharacterized coiled-coil DUF342 family protein
MAGIGNETNYLFSMDNSVIVNPEKDLKRHLFFLMNKKREALKEIRELYQKIDELNSHCKGLDRAIIQNKDMLQRYYDFITEWHRKHGTSSNPL